MADDKQIQQIYSQMQLVDQHIQRIEQQINLLNSKVEELRELKETINQVASANKSKTLFDIGSGVYAPGELDKVKELLINVGAGVFVRKSPSEAVKIVDAQIENSNKYLADMNMSLQFMNQQAATLQEQAKKIVG